MHGELYYLWLLFQAVTPLNAKQTREEPSITDFSPMLSSLPSDIGRHIQGLRLSGVAVTSRSGIS